jgi:hypothetical protein
MPDENNKRLPSSNANDRPGIAPGLLVFTSSFVTLFVEMVEPKLFQFLKVFGHEMGAVAVAMLGLGFAGLISYLINRGERALLRRAAWLLGPCVLVSFFVTARVPHPIAAALSCALPFFMAGLITSLSYVLFSSWQIYGLSLLGSGLGIAAMFVCLPALGAEGSMLAAAVLASAAGVFAVFIRDSSASISRSLAYALPPLLLCLVIFVIHLAANSFDILKIAPRHPRAGELAEPGRLATEAVRLPGAKHLAGGWSAISRVDAVITPSLSMEDLTYPDGKAGIENPLVLEDIRESFGSRAHLYANNVWFSSMPDRDRLPSPLIPYSLLERPRVLVIGVGGGIDLARARALEPRRLVGVEINPATVELLQGPLKEISAGIYGRAEIIVMDGRTYVHFCEDKFDLINLVFADLYIPFHLSNIFMESYLYTVEAFEDYINILSDHGYLSVTKMFFNDTATTEILRITATAMEAARQSGIPSPENNIAVIGFSSGREDAYGGTMLFKKSAFSDRELAEIKAQLAPPLFALYLPGEPLPDNPFIQVVSASDPSEFYESYLLDVSPPTDDKPFFYLFDKSLSLHKQVVLSFLGLTVIVFWMWFIIIVARKQRYKQPAYGMGAVLIVFLAMGYIFVQTSLVQRLNLYLGGPLYSLSAVSAAFLIYPGIAGFMAARYQALRKPALIVAIPVALVLYGPILSYIISGLPLLDTPLRVAAVFTLLAPMCLPIGLPFPLALDRIKALAGDRAAGLFYGVSATAGVIMVTVSLYWSARLGIQSLYLAGAAAYIIVFILAIPLARLSRQD